MQLPDTQGRVPLHTAGSINRQITTSTSERLRWFADHPEHIARRLRDLDSRADDLPPLRQLEVSHVSFCVGPREGRPANNQRFTFLSQDPAEIGGKGQAQNDLVYWTRMQRSGPDANGSPRLAPTRQTASL